MLKIQNPQRLRRKPTIIDIVGTLLINLFFSFFAALPMAILLSFGIICWTLIWWTFKVNNLWGVIAAVIFIAIGRIGTRVYVKVGR